MSTETWIANTAGKSSATIAGNELVRVVDDPAGTPASAKVSIDNIKDYILGLANTFSVAGAASTPAMRFTGAWFTGGSATTTKPQLLIEPTGATSTGWSTSGTGLGVNAASGFSGNLLDLQVNGATKLSVSSGGTVLVAAGAAFQTSGRGTFKWNSTTALALTNGSAQSVILDVPAADTLAQVNGATAQTFQHFGYFSSATSLTRGVIKHATTTLASVTGASVTASNLRPAGAFVIGVATTVTVALGEGSGTTGYTVGDGTDPDRYGAVTGVAIGTDTDNSDATADPTGFQTAAADIVITAAGGNFDGTGSIVVDVFYLTTEAA